MKLETLIRKEDNREDSFWYYGQDIARVQFPNGKKLYAESRGEIRIQFESSGTFYKGIQAVEMARDLNLIDSDLNKIGQDFGWDMNNWFAIIEVDINGDRIGDDLAILGSYDEAIESLIKLSAELYNKYYK
jgi:hypothetical protein